MNFRPKPVLVYITSNFSTYIVNCVSCHRWDTSALVNYSYSVNSTFGRLYFSVFVDVLIEKKKISTRNIITRTVRHTDANDGRPPHGNSFAPLPANDTPASCFQYAQVTTFCSSGCYHDTVIACGVMRLGVIGAVTRLIFNASLPRVSNAL